MSQRVPGTSEFDESSLSISRFEPIKSRINFDRLKKILAEGLCHNSVKWGATTNTSDFGHDISLIQYLFQYFRHTTLTSVLVLRDSMYIHCSCCQHWCIQHKQKKEKNRQVAKKEKSNKQQAQRHKHSGVDDEAKTVVPVH